MAEIMIDRSLVEVWSVITDVSSWKSWWGGDLKSVTPGWQVGAAVTWATGGGTTVFDFAERKRIGLKGSYGEKVVWAFNEVPGGRTSVSMGEDLSSSGLVAASSAATQATHDSHLLKLKNCVESRYPVTAQADKPKTAVQDAGQATRAKQLLETLDNYSASSAQKVAARKELLSMGGAAVAPILDFIEADHKLFGEVELLAEIGGSAVEPILARLDTCGWYTFMRGTAALGQIRDPRAVPFLITKLQCTDWSNSKQRCYAADALGEIGNPSAVPALIAVLEVGDHNDYTWRQSSKALGKIGDQRAIEPLLAIFRKGKLIQGQVRSDEKMHERMVPAAFSLAMLGVAEVEDAIKQMIAHAGDAYRLPYVTTDEADELKTALRQMRSKSLPPSAAADAQRRDLLEAIKSEDVGRRKKACYESAAVGGIEIVQALINALERDPGPQYNKAEDLFQSSRKGAAYALGKLGDPSSMPVLLKVLKNDFPWELRNGAPVERPDNPHKMELGMPVFGTSVREGLQEAATEFARSVLAQVPAKLVSVPASSATTVRPCIFKNGSASVASLVRETIALEKMVAALEVENGMLGFQSCNSCPF